MGLIQSLGGGALGVEQASFEVLEKRNNYEIRRYAQSVLAVAEATVEQPDQKDSALFMVLAAYIGVRGSASNSQRRAIKMTAPVLTNLQDTGAGMRKSMAFVLPSVFKSVHQAPSPTNPRVFLLHLPERTLAVSRFSGLADMADSKRRASALASALLSDGHTPLSFPSSEPIISSVQRRGGMGMVIERETMRVLEVMEGSRAETSQILVGDVIFKVNGLPVASPQELSAAVGSSSQGAVITLCRQGGGEHQIILDRATEEGQAAPEQSSDKAQSTALQAFEGWTLARYDPPFVLPALRTNEIMIPILEKDGEGEERGGAQRSAHPEDEDEEVSTARYSAYLFTTQKFK
jgi:hypothetical protein